MPFSNMPDAANSLWERVYNASKKAGDSEKVAAQKAWSAVKGAYKKVGEKWVKKSEYESELSMSIVKSTYTKKDNTMRIRMVASDDGKDWHGERMSVGLFEKFIERIEKLDVPQWLTPYLEEKSGWSGGMPYLSISHYNSGLEGNNIAGNVEKIYVDGNRLKAVAVLKDNELGRAVFKAINEDIEGVSKYEDKIRVSIKFADLAHAHDGTEFVRDSLETKCEACDNYPVDVYKDGLLIHLAFTRKPANPRSNIEVDKMADEILTRKDDAVSIVGDELAEQLEVNKSTLPEDSIIVTKDEKVTEEENVPTEEEVAPVPDEKAVQEVIEPEVVEPTVIASEVSEVATESDTPAQPSPLEAVFAELSKKIDESSKRCKTKSEFITEVQPMLNALTVEIEKMYKEPAPEETPEDEEEDKKDKEDEVSKSILSAIQDLVGKVDAVVNDVATLKSQMVEKADVEKADFTPHPRQIVIKTNVVQPAKPDSIQEIALRSVMKK